MTEPQHNPAPSIDELIGGPPAPAALRCIPENIPAELQALPQWVVWKLIPRDGKLAKILFQPCGITAKSNDPRTWGTFSDACQAYATGRWAGIGFVFSADDPYCGIDLDDCISADGSIAEWAQDILDRFPGAYAEVSPSGAGIKLICKAALPGKGKHPEGIGIFDRGRFFALTGDILRRAAE
ncbi:MAG: hypothetical protein KF861_12195 [Planctomycetaceae bacterium]|nr:hypothetical protein [Planctomycetaceae bacterium]